MKQPGFVMEIFGRFLSRLGGDDLDEAGACRGSAANLMTQNRRML